MTTLTPLGMLNGRSSVISDTLSSTNLSDDQSFSLRATGSLNLNLTGLNSSAIVQLRSSSGAVLQTASATAVSSGAVTFDGLSPSDHKGLAAGTYTVHVEVPPTSNPPGTGSGGSGGTGGTGTGTGTGGTGSGTTPSNGLYVYDFSYTGTITRAFSRDSTPLRLNIGDSISGTFEISGLGALDGFVGTSFTWSGGSIAPRSGTTSFGNFVYPDGSIGISLDGISDGSPPGLVNLYTGLVNNSGLIFLQPAGTSIPAAIGSNGSGFSFSSGLQASFSDNVVVTSLTPPYAATGSGTGTGTGSTGGSGSTGTGNGSGSTGTGSTGSTGNGNSSITFTLTLTADYARNTTTDADKEITSKPTFTKDSSKYLNTTSTGVLQDFIGSSDTKDYYSFQVNTPSDNTHSGTNVSVKLKGLAANVTVQFLDSTGKELARTTVTGTEGSLQHIFGSGTYYVDVLSGGGDTNYTLDFAETPLTTNLTYSTTGNTPFLTNLWEFDASGKSSTAGIDPTKPTVVIIHGWNKSNSTEYGTGDLLAQLATAIASNLLYAGEQVLALDWGAAAYDPGSYFGLVPLTAAGRVKGVADWAESELQALGFVANQITLIGHSLGAYVADLIGHSSFGQVANLYALDPAGPYAITTYNLNAANGGAKVPISRFDGAAAHSYAFFDPLTPADDSTQARTAQYAFVAYNSLLDVLHPIRDHFEGVYTLTALVGCGKLAANLSFPYTPLQFQYTVLGSRVKKGSPIDKTKYDGYVNLSNANGITSFQYVNASGQVASVV